jgi:hypothetical protein
MTMTFEATAAGGSVRVGAFAWSSPIFATLGDSA